MLLNSVVIVLREVLEAVLLLSVFLACARFLRISNRWVVLALIAGALGALFYGYMLEPVSDLFDGVGQEVCNAFLQVAVFALILLIAFYFARRARDQSRYGRVLQITMATAVALSITREGSEILVYVSGFWSVSDIFSAVAIGSIIGACIGFSVGVLIFFLLLAQPSQRVMPISVVLLLLIAAGMSSQATRLLMQADWISAGAPLWNTSAILAEDSLVGQLFYALIGYEATPSATEVIVYVGTIVLVAASFYAGRFVGLPSMDEQR